jgi:ubiquinone/menaquinone biosynthesis C-methylase UbiE
MDQQTIDTYNKMAKEYDDETIDFWNLFPRTFLNKFIELSGQKIIDVGSGPGRDGLLIQQAGKEVICVDASEAMVNLSSERGLKSVVADFDSLPFENGTFDAVWSYTALLHTPKKSIDTSLKEISRVLKPAGIFALGLIEGSTEEYRESSGVDMPRWFSFYQKEEVVDLCKKHGFELVYFEIFKPGSKNYLNFIFKKYGNR